MREHAPGWSPRSARGPGRPPVVAVRWMKVVSGNRLLPGPAVVEAADSSNHGIAVASTVTQSTREPTTVLPFGSVLPRECVWRGKPWDPSLVTSARRGRIGTFAS